MPAPMAKARSLNLMTLMPMASATSSSSRIAIHAPTVRVRDAVRDEHRYRAEDDDEIEDQFVGEL